MLHRGRRRDRDDRHGEVRGRENDVAEHMTPTSRESIREKSRAGQLTRRRAISGSGAWNKRKGVSFAEKGWREKQREREIYTLLRVAGRQHARVSTRLHTRARARPLFVEIHSCDFIGAPSRRVYLISLRVQVTSS